MGASRYLAGAKRVGGVVVLLVGAAVLHLLRQRGVPVWNSLWAEDARVFLSGAFDSFGGTLFEQNGGYIHVVPRLIAGVAAVFPVRDAAAVMAAGAAAVVALVAGFVYLASSTVLRSRGARVALAAAVLLLPIPGSELLANATNLHFYLLFACFWALLWQSEATADVACRSVVVTATALSDPLSALFLPLAITGPIVRRSIRSVTVSALFLVSLATQLVIMVGGEHPGRNWSFRLGALPDIFSLRVAGGLLVGDRFLRDAWLAYGRGFSYGALLIVAALILLLLLRSDRRTAAFSLIAVVYAGLFFCVQLIERGTAGMDPELRGFQLNGARYVLLPFLFLTSVILALVERRHGRHRSVRWKWGRRAVLLWLAALVALNYSVDSDRSRGPRWDRELRNARADCSSPTRNAAQVLAAPSPPRVWFASVPCKRLP